ncbi:PAS domain S-box protein [Martelella sp. HB161492]|uniref:PAS domain S-box protein n=1 Tax=Martelella sp. HB161492 TaxID=2720726 RepID=UPI0015926649|nr:PAS domain S-box protein [Martelella sp. HB161492]
MTTEPIAFVEFATHPQVRAAFAAGHTLFAVHCDDNSIAFCNAAGASLLGHQSIAAATDAPFAPDSIMLRQFSAAAGSLAHNGDTRDFTIHRIDGFRRVAVPARASRISLEGEDLFVFDADFGQTDARLTAGFSDDGAQLAILDNDGRIIEESQGFAALSLDPSDLAAMRLALQDSDAPSLQRLTDSAAGIWHATLARLDDERLMLYVSGQHAEPVPDPVPAFEIAPEPQETASRSVIDMIAAIDQGFATMTSDAPQAEAPVVARRPLRFVWQSNAEGRFTEVSRELTDAVGVDAADIIGLRFEDLEDQLGVRGAKAIAGLLPQASTWSGKTVEWPIAGTDRRIPIDLAALPSFSRDRIFNGYRGFGLARIGDTRQDPDATGLALVTAEQPPLPGLNDAERQAFDEIALTLSGSPTATPEMKEKRSPVLRRTVTPEAVSEASPPAPEKRSDRPTLDRRAIDALPDAVLIQSGEQIIHANPHMMSLSGYDNLDEITAAGGPDQLLQRDGQNHLILMRADGSVLPVSLQLQSIRFEDSRALSMTLRTEPSDHEILALSGSAPALAAPAVFDANDEDGEALQAILDTTTDGIVIIDADGRISSLSASALGLFGRESETVCGKRFTVLFAEESRRDIEDYLDRVIDGQSLALMHEGCEVMGREAGGGLLPLVMTLGRLPRSGGACAVLRDISEWKRHEDELRAARRSMARIEQEREGFLTMLKLELKMPLDAIIALGDTLRHEPYGALGDQRYKEIAQAVSEKSRQARNVVGDILGEMPAPRVAEEEAMSASGINDVIAESVSIVQPRANARRIIIRAALSPGLTDTLADAGRLKEIALDLLYEAVHFTPAGGQVVVSTARAPDGGTLLRFRDNGIAPVRRRPAAATASGKTSEPENARIAHARQLVESIGGTFTIHAVPNEGMLVQVFLPVNADAA